MWLVQIKSIKILIYKTPFTSLVITDLCMYANSVFWPYLIEMTYTIFNFVWFYHKYKCTKERFAIHRAQFAVKIHRNYRESIRVKFSVFYEQFQIICSNDVNSVYLSWHILVSNSKKGKQFGLPLPLFPPFLFSSLVVYMYYSL